ncbi:MAG: ribonuclease H-like domain-containing protein, partial [Candidatus Limnocylindrales bacterium]
MTAPAVRPPSQGADLSRRLERFRHAIRSTPGEGIDPLPHAPIPSADLAERLATTLDGEVVTTPFGRYVRVDGRSTVVPVDRDRLAGLPGQPPADRPLVCLDTETTGLATAAGTVAFLIGLGWWAGTTFRQVQLLLPDHADEAALLDELARHVPPDAWLVTYNGRGFDWPLLVTRYRLARRAAPAHDGHLDLLPIVRRLFRHRMDDARLQTVERSLLGVERHDDVDGWEIPGRYLGFLRGGPAHPLLAVVRHNDEDVRSLGRLVAHLDRSFGDPATRHQAPRGDLAGLGRAFRRERRLEEALACLDDALAAPAGPTPTARDLRPAIADQWWSPQRRADFGGRPDGRVTRPDHAVRAA